MVERCLEAAEHLGRQGVVAEVVDLRSIAPLDHPTVCESVAKTGRLVVVDEDYESFGLSGELTTRVLENLGPQALRGYARVAQPDTPLPAAEVLERELIPTTERIVVAATAAIEGVGYRR
jgi:pyruvate dehydrogenase E1 component beta subunit